MEMTETGRSWFVTILAWILICVFGLGSLCGAVMNVLHWIHFYWLPARAAFAVGIILVVYGLLFVASVGLLRRRNWARVAILACFWLWLSSWLLIALIQAWRHRLGEIECLDIIGFLAIACLIGLVIRELHSARIRQEFQQ